MKHLRLTMRRVSAVLLLTYFLCAQAFAAMPEYLIPGGNTVGIKLYTDGLVITALDSPSPAKKAGLRAGDTILEINGAPVHSAQEVSACLAGGASVRVRILRQAREAEFLVAPEKCACGYRLGAYIRDHISGIGTLTFYDPETGLYGALGHGVNDPSGLRLLRTPGGYLVASSVSDVKKSTCGTPGALQGSFDPDRRVGLVSQNSACGIFGTLETPPVRAAIPVGKSAQVHTGAAVILANVDGTAVQEYCVRIEKLYPQAAQGRNLLLRVTDARLLEKTGGIVQGMSGSPILQDGKLIGAVTHVLVNSPEKGYGIFIENMLSAAG